MPNQALNLEILPCSTAELTTVRDYIARFELDNNALEATQFLLAKEEGSVVGFGRIRQYADCYELCSLGVIEPERRKGVGRALVKALIATAGRPLYLVCIIPEYFEELHFRTCAQYPEPVQRKLDYCVSSLPVPEPYVAMRYEG